ncbi:hypothetical protein BJX63DRAFT_176517 [Aspergillus granulosus]|uniref:NADH dehydrogenase [ubiquinone] 1 alpha subcomplex subunit n=1 Tax=Aspergillus granulosus TaxID=176169 RepID=A0ABR4I2H7_9EURO
MSPINSLWFKWKSLRLPWRRSFLVGYDLSGNTYWEFKDTLNSGRFRRIVKPRARTHYSDLELSPQWHQWLRYVRSEPPSTKEQQDDIQRRQRILLLAEMHRQKWEAERSQLDAPATQQSGPATRTSDPTITAAAPGKVPGADAPRTKEPGRTRASTAKEDPSFRPKDAPGEKWQPESWTPTSSKR